MLAEYTRRFYCPAAARYRYLTGDAMAKAKAFAQWKAEIRQTWSEFAIKEVLLNTSNGNGGEQLNPRQPPRPLSSRSYSRLNRRLRSNPNPLQCP
jgi:hypothetical protein